MVVSASLDRARITEITQAIADRIEGDWLLVGGALAALWFEPRRTTEDVDIIPMGDPKRSRTALFELAAELGLPIEAMNSAADFFVERVTGWRDETELLLEGRLGRIFRPSPTLFLILKMGRLSEIDLTDCLELLRIVGEQHLQLDRDRALEALDRLPRAEDLDLISRRERLRNALVKRELQR